MIGSVKGLQNPSKGVNQSNKAHQIEAAENPNSSRVGSFSDTGTMKQPKMLWSTEVISHTRGYTCFDLNNITGEQDRTSMATELITKMIVYDLFDDEVELLRSYVVVLSVSLKMRILSRDCGLLIHSRGIHDLSFRESFD
nr:hypothetical protein [Tanacetum cinerariifolium]